MKNKIEYFEFTVGEEIPQEVIDGKMKAVVTEANKNE